MDEIPLPEPVDPPKPGLLARLMPLLTLVIALSAIGLAIWEGLENRRHNRLTVQPRIGAEIDAATDGTTESVRIGIESTGLGPAVFTAFRIYFDGELQDSSDALGTGRWMAVGRALEGDSTAQMNAQAFSEGYFFPPGAQATLFEVSRPQRVAGDAAQPLISLLDRLAIQICYCSVYESDCDDVQLTTGDTRMQPCPVPGRDEDAGAS